MLTMPRANSAKHFLLCTIRVLQDRSLRALSSHNLLNVAAKDLFGYTVHPAARSLESTVPCSQGLTETQGIQQLCCCYLLQSLQPLLSQPVDNPSRTPIPCSSGILHVVYCIGIEPLPIVRFT